MTTLFPLARRSFLLKTFRRQFAFAAPLACVPLLVLSGCKGHTLPGLRSNSPEYSSNLQQVAGSGHSDMLKWNQFADDQPAVQKFYGDRNWEIAWSRNGKPTHAATAMTALFTEADKKGLHPEDYDGQQWQQHLHALSTANGDKDTIAQFDVAMSLAAIRYLDDLHLGRINPQSLNFDIDVPGKRQAFNVADVLNKQIVDADDPKDAVESVEPQNAMYKATEAMLPHYLELAEKVAAQPADPLPGVTKAVAPGGTYAGMAQLVQRLALEGDGTPQAEGNRYTPEVAQAVEHFQSRTGLKTDGKLSQGTLDAMNVPMSVRVQQIDDSLEKWRWLPDNFVKPRVLVNLPEFYVRTYNPGGDLAFKMKMIDGEDKDNHDTPVFVRTMRYVVFRPYWNLPIDIMKKDLLKHGRGYMDAHDYEVVTTGGKPVSDWTMDDLEHARYRVRQKPGPKNSLGLIKFMFPNEYDIYLHSTPETYLFNLMQRDRSHGCIRLNDPEKMANWVLDGQGDWDAAKIHQAMYGEPLPGQDPTGQGDSSQGSDDPDSGPTATGDEVKNNHQVNLKTPLSVVITYLTANADEDGTMHFFGDLYGYDKLLNDALAKPRPYDRKPAKINPKLTAGETA